jgi:hypothetical protein
VTPFLNETHVLQSKDAPWNILWSLLRIFFFFSLANVTNYVMTNDRTCVRRVKNLPVELIPLETGKSSLVCVMPILRWYT